MTSLSQNPLCALGTATLYALALSTGTAFSAPAFSATLTLIEAPDSLGHYAPVNFSGSPTATSPTFPGISFTANSGLSTTTDLSPHAAEVLTQIVGPSAPGRSAVTSVQAMSSSDYLSRILRPSLTSGPKPPLKLPGKPLFVNASFTGSAATDVLDSQLLASTDTLIARDKVFFAAGAVTDIPDVASRASLLWAASNVLAVRGTSESTFNPATNTAGRHYANLWTTGTASNATADLTSYALALSQNSRFSKKPATPALLRATLMTSADRSNSTLGTWVPDNVNGLDSDLGAGKADLTAAQSLIASAAPTFTKTKNLTLKGPFETGPKPKPVPAIASNANGATTFTLAKNAQLASLFELESPLSSLTATLTWDVAKAGSDARLDLCTVTLDDKGNAVLSGSLLSRDANGDNVRFLASDATLAPGLYAWLITNQGATPLTPAFAFSFTPTTTTASLLVTPTSAPLVAVPEPAALAPLAATLLLLKRKRRAAHF